MIPRYTWSEDTMHPSFTPSSPQITPDSPRFIKVLMHIPRYVRIRPT